MNVKGVVTRSEGTELLLNQQEGTSMWKLLQVYMVSACTVLIAACTEFSSRATVVDFADRLAQAEEQKAIVLAERGLEGDRYRAEGKMLYVVDVELIRDKEAEEKGSHDQLILVTHYQYDGDMAIFSTVNLTQSVVVNVERTPHVPVPLSQEEFVRAKTLALAHPDVKSALDPYKDRLTIDPLLTRTPAEKDPLYGHRVVSLLFRVDSDYLTMPEVMVDLTMEEVLVQKEKPSR